MGSATPQNTSPIPIPALNNMANQEALEKSGVASFPPRRMLPNLEKAKNTKKKRSTFTKRIKNQPEASLMTVCARANKSSAGSPMMIVAVMVTNNTISEPKKTGGLIAAPKSVFLSLLMGVLIRLE